MILVIVIVIVIMIVIVIVMDKSASTGRSLCLIAGRGAAALGIVIGIGIGAFLAVLTARHIVPCTLYYLDSIDSIRLIRFDSTVCCAVLCCAVYRVSEVFKYTTLPLLFVSFPIIVLYAHVLEQSSLV